MTARGASAGRRLLPCRSASGTWPRRRLRRRTGRGCTRWRRRACRPTSGGHGRLSPRWSGRANPRAACHRGGLLPPGRRLPRSRSTPDGSLGQPHYPRRRDPRALPAPGAGHRRPGGALRRRRDTASTSWAARCATPSSPTAQRRRDPITTSTSPPTPGPTRSRRSSRGWADAVWLQGKRFGTIGRPQGRADARDHDPPRRGLPARLAQARGGLRRRRSRSTCRGATSPSTPWRCGSPTSSSSTPSAASPTSPRAPAAHAARPGGLLLRRPAADAASGAVHRRLRPRARRRSSSTAVEAMHDRLLDRLGRADPRRARQAHGA